MTDRSYVRQEREFKLIKLLLQDRSFGRRTDGSRPVRVGEGGWTGRGTFRRIPLLTK